MNVIQQIIIRPGLQIMVHDDHEISIEDTNNGDAIRVQVDDIEGLIVALRGLVS